MNHDISTLDVRPPAGILDSFADLWRGLGLDQLVGEGEFQQGLLHLGVEAARVAQDAATAAARGVPLAVAAHDEVSYPFLTRLHT